MSCVVLLQIISLTRRQWSKTLQNIESSDDAITAHFEDGSSYKGKLLVACDGARSRSRQILYPTDHAMNPLPVQLLGASAFYNTEEMGGVQSIDPYIFQGSHPDTDVFLFFSCASSVTQLGRFEYSNKLQSWILRITLMTVAKTATTVRLLFLGPIPKGLPCRLATPTELHS